jgi:hypothetical protein
MGGYDTKDDTKPQPERTPVSQLIEKNGGDDETRTRDLCRDSLGIHVLSATYILAGAAKSLKGTVGTACCG